MVFDFFGAIEENDKKGLEKIQKAATMLGSIRKKFRVSLLKKKEVRKMIS